MWQEILVFTLFAFVLVSFGIRQFKPKKKVAKGPCDCGKCH